MEHSSILKDKVTNWTVNLFKMCLLKMIFIKNSRRNCSNNKRWNLWKVLSKSGVSILRGLRNRLIRIKLRIILRKCLHLVVMFLIWNRITAISIWYVLCLILSTEKRTFLRVWLRNSIKKLKWKDYQWSDQLRYLLLLSTTNKLTLISVFVN